MTNNDDTIDSFRVNVPVIGRVTKKGYGVALSHPFEKKGVLCWFESRQAYAEATGSTYEARRSDEDGSEFYYAKQCETYESGRAATQALLEFEDSDD